MFRPSRLSVARPSRAALRASVASPMSRTLRASVASPMSRTLRASVAGVLLIGSSVVAAPAFADNDFVVLTGGSVTEPDSGQTSLVFTASVASSPSAPINMHFVATGNHTSVLAADATAGSACGGSGSVDFVAVDGTIQIPTHADPPQVTVSVPVCGDTAIEGNETFTAIVNNVQGAGAYCLEVCAAHGLIVDNDTAQPIPIVLPPTLSVSNASAVEGTSFLFTSSRRLTFNVSLSAATKNTVAVRYATLEAKGGANGGASCSFPGTDFINASGTLQFNPNETVKQVFVTLCGDTVNEANETFTLHLSSPVGASILDGTGVGTIIDDD